MSLPSQGGFSSLRRGGMYRRRRRRRSTSWFIVLVAASAITWFIWPDGDSDDLVDQPIAIAGTSVGASDISNSVLGTDENPDDVERKNVVQYPVHMLQDSPIPQAKLSIEPAEGVLSTTDHSQLSPAGTTKIEDAKDRKITTGQSPSTTLTPIPLAATTSIKLEEGLTLLDGNHRVAARLSLSTSLRSGVLTPSETAQARGVLRDISDTLVFSPELVSDDPFAIEYRIRGGDTLSGIVHKMGLQVDWRFIQRINRIKQASGIRPGQIIKLITGPFHAILHKSAYRIDFYLGEGDEQVYIRSYRVALGEFNSTPIGLFKVRPNSKLVNPTWIHPNTREFYSADNPMNPIGERWIGLQGIEERTIDLSGLGIHGTIEPESIGTDASMGCIRMLSDDVAEAYEMLVEGVSTVAIYE